jgi:predicted dehydrogenase
MLCAAGAYQGLRSGFVLYGTEGTLQLDLSTKKLTLGLKEEGKLTLSRSTFFDSFEAQDPCVPLSGKDKRPCSALHEDGFAGAGIDVSLIKEVHVGEEKKGSWRVEEEFIGAIQGQEKVTLTDFGKGYRYMEFTEAVTRSIQSGVAVKLPLKYLRFFLL